ncbi:MAG: HlyC/CorC family transporter [Candidatus Schekmanbacteria bacterium]|nr:HlyC/CorC family transporter [Candidatus Schekmanbacteria bacterium]
MFASILFLELLLIALLILANGFFSWAEFAVISSRRSRIAQWVSQGKRGAGIVEGFRHNPAPFLATVQIGVTLVGTLASALGGALAVTHIRPLLAEIPWLNPWAEPVAIGLVVIVMTYLTLLFGEMVPKSLALFNPEKSACTAARPIRTLSGLFSVVVKLLTYSTHLVLKLMKKTKPEKESFISEEEVRFMLSQGAAQGVFDTTESKLIPMIFDFSNAVVRDVMIPRTKICAIDLKTTREELLHRVAEELYTRLPVYKHGLDHIVGILHMKDLIYTMTIGRAVILQDLLRTPLFVQADQPAQEVLTLFQRKRQHMAIVKEGEQTVGLITMEDLLENIVGDIRDEQD